MTTTMPAIRLEHALVEVRDLDQSLAFYRQLMPDWTIRWDGRTRGDQWVHFGPPGEGRLGYLSLWQAGEEAAGDGGGLRISHLGFVHPDVRGLVAAAGRAGLAPAHPVIDDGVFRRVYFRDPNGHEVEFVQGPLT